MSFIVRQLTVVDVPALHALMGQVFTYLSDRYYPALFVEDQRVHFTEEGLTKRLERPHFIALGCFEGADLVGFAFGTDLRPDGMAFLEWIGIAPSHMRRGVFSVLLGEFEQRARDAGAHKLYFYTSRKNTPAIRGYLKFGYAIEGIHPDHFMGVDMLSLGKVFTHKVWPGTITDQPDFPLREVEVA